MSRFGSRFTTKAVAALVLAVAPLFASADVSDVIPGDAVVVVHFNKLEATSAKFGKFFDTVALSQTSPDLSDPLGSFLKKMKLGEGIDKSKDAAIVVIGHKHDGAEEMEFEPLVLIPVSDYDAFVKSIAGATTEGNVTTAKLADDEEDKYIAKWGDYAAIAEEKEHLATKPTGLKVTGKLKGEWDNKDITVWANIPALKTLAAPELAKAREQMKTEMTNNFGDGNPEIQKFAPVASAVMDMYFNAANTFLADADGATLSVNLTDKGLNFGAVADFREGTYLGKMVSGLKSTDLRSLAGLPDGRYLGYAVAVSDPATVKQLMNDMGVPIIKSLPNSEPATASAIDSAVASFSKMTEATKVSRIGWLAPKGQLGQESLFQVVSVMEGDSAAFKQAWREYSASSEQLMKAMGGINPAMSSATIKIEQDAKTVNDVKFDVVTTDFGEATTPEQQQMVQMMNMMYGPDGAKQLIGAVNDKVAVFSMGVDDVTLSNVITAARDGGNALSVRENIVATAGELPAKGFAAGYFQLDQLVTTGAGYAQQFGFPMQLSLPPDLAPIGFAVSNDDAALRVDTHVPTSLIQSMVAAGMQMMSQMGGGM